MVQKPPFCLSASRQAGIGLITAVALLTIVAFGVALIASAVFQVASADNELRTAADLAALKLALTGNPGLRNSGGRSDFGFIGTMGSVPAALSDLWQKGSQPAYAFDDAKKAGAGWIGPYVPNMLASELLVLNKDRFGNDLVYTSAPFTRPSDGQVVAARIRSAGPDATSDTSDDQQVDILRNEIFATVTGTLLVDDDPVGSASVILNVPANGLLTELMDVTDSNGIFQFTDVSLGFRSLSINPKLTYEHGSATVNGGDSARFSITNYGTDPVTLTSLTATYNFTGWYQQIQIGGTTVFNYNNAPWNGTRAGSGQTITFSSSVAIGGSGRPVQIVPIRVDKGSTVTQDVVLKGVGSTVQIRLNDFRNVQTGSGSSVNPTGATITVTFSDGSQVTVTLP
jgi:hypothetical protein